MIYIHSIYQAIGCFISGDSLIFIFGWQNPFGLLGLLTWDGNITSLHQERYIFKLYEQGTNSKVKEEFLKSLHKLPKSRWSNSSFCNFCQLIHPHTANQRFQNKLKSSVSDSDRMTSPTWPRCSGFSVATGIPFVLTVTFTWEDGWENRWHCFPSSPCSQSPWP